MTIQEQLVVYNCGNYQCILVFSHVSLGGLIAMRCKFHCVGGGKDLIIVLFCDSIHRVTACIQSSFSHL